MTDPLPAPGPVRTPMPAAEAPKSLGEFDTHWVRSLYEHPLEACERIFGVRPLVERELAQARADGTANGQLSYLEAPFLAGLKCYPSTWRPHINAVMARATGKTETLVKLRTRFALTLLPLLLKYLYGLRGDFWALADKPLVQVLVISRRVDNSIDLLEKATGRLEAEPWMRELFVDADHWTKKSRRTKVGAQVDVHPCDDSLRGYHGARIPLGGGRYFVTPVLVIVEEAVFVKNLDYVLREIIFQYLGGEVLLTSSPYGKHGPVWQAWTHELPIRFANYTASQLMNPLIPRARILAMLRRLIELGQKNVANQEILGRFASDSGLYIPNVVWLRAVDHELDWWSLDMLKQLPGRILGRFTLGIDPNGGTADEDNHPVGLGLIQHHPKETHQVRWFAKAHLALSEVLDIVKLLDAKLSLERINVDAVHGAAYPLLCSTAGVRARVEVIPNSPQRQLSYMTKLRDLMALGWLHLPHDPVLHQEQQSLTRGLLEGDASGIEQLSTIGKRTRLPDGLAALGLAVDQEAARSIAAPGVMGIAFGRHEPSIASAVAMTAPRLAVRPSLTSVGVRR